MIRGIKRGREKMIIINYETKKRNRNVSVIRQKTRVTPRKSDVSSNLVKSHIQNVHKHAINLKTIEKDVSGAK